MAKRQFGISTHLYHAQRLSRGHLLEIATHGFEAVEVAAIRTHFDFANPAAVADLQQWLAEARLDLHGLHVPMNAADGDAEGALLVARRIPLRALTLQVARPRDAAKTIDRLAALATPLQVTVAVDSSSEGLTPVGSLVHFVEAFDARVEVSFDCGRGQRDADLVDAIEIASEHLVTMHVPVESRIDWASVLTTVQKVGYEGPIIIDPPPRTSTKEMLRLARGARERFEKLLCTSI